MNSDENGWTRGFRNLRLEIGLRWRIRRHHAAEARYRREQTRLEAAVARVQVLVS